ncbi:hypothetical protein B4135_0512 [Caldibacillus debilis]|uniref:Uncharacterized protein n=1 Tax=Caldibacillus debilis TaxID=301148 RepID=A0A150L9A8_9BACI|nr:hypothetical protein B4135_0512 [Caldibacillus debilis]
MRIRKDRQGLFNPVWPRFSNRSAGTYERFHPGAAGRPSIRFRGERLV